MYYIGIDLGGTNIAVGLVDDKGNIIYKESVPTLREREYSEIIKDMAVLALKVIKEAGVDLKDVKSIGVGAPGAINSLDAVLIYANNLKFDNVSIRNELNKFIDLPIYLDNDANVAALAESVAGAAKGVKHSITITLGTGVGSGVVVDGKVYSGFNNAAAELGHMVIIQNGAACTCGRKGCWEAYASATALIEQAREAAFENPNSLLNTLVEGDLSKLNAKIPFDAAKQDDEAAIKVVNQYINYLAEGLANIINIFQPEIVAIGGGVCKQGEYLLKPLRERVKERIYCVAGMPITEIKVAQMGNDAGIIGAAMLGRA